MAYPSDDKETSAQMVDVELQLDDEAIDRLIGGEVPEGREDLGAVAWFAEAVRAAYRSEAPPQPDEELAALLSGGFAGPNGSSAGTNVTPIDEAPLRRRGRRTGMLGAAAAMVAILLLGGLGAAGGLPRPVQDAVAGVAGKVGLDFSNSDNGNDEIADVAEKLQRVFDDAELEEFLADTQAWLDCVNEHLDRAFAALTPGEIPSSQQLDPTAACGPHPSPGDYGLTALAADTQQIAGQVGSLVGRADDFGAAVKDWVQCVRTEVLNAVTSWHPDGTTVTLDLEAACGTPPAPADYGLDEIIVEWPTDIEIPKVDLPPISLPEVSIPETTIPTVTVPEVSIPDHGTPTISIPQISIPGWPPEDQS